MGKRMVKEHTIILMGSKSIGEHKDDQPNGQGTMTYPDREKCVGEWFSWRISEWKMLRQRRNHPI